MGERDKNHSDQKTVLTWEVLHHCSDDWLKCWFFHFHLVSLGNTLLCSPFLWRWTTPLWQESRSHRLAPQSSHTTILWRPATSVSFPPTVSRVSRPHLVKIVSYRLRMSFFFFYHLEINIVLHCCPTMNMFWHWFIRTLPPPYSTLCSYC